MKPNKSLIPAIKHVLDYLDTYSINDRDISLDEKLYVLQQALTKVQADVTIRYMRELGIIAPDPDAPL